MTHCMRTLLLALFGLAPGLALSQTAGQLAKFDASGGLVDSVVTEDASGNIGIGTTTPAAKLQVVGGNVSLDFSSPTTGNILKSGLPFLHNSGLSNTFVGLAAGNLTLTGGFKSTRDNTRPAAVCWERTQNIKLSQRIRPTDDLNEVRRSVHRSPSSDGLIAAARAGVQSVAAKWTATAGARTSSVDLSCHALLS